MRHKAIDANHPSELGALLGTEDRAEQLSRIRGMLESLKQPAVMVTLALDPRVGRLVITATDSTGAPLAFEAVHQILDLARRELVRVEADTLAKQTIAKASETSPKE